MHWTVAGAGAIIALRCCNLSEGSRAQPRQSHNPAVRPHLYLFARCEALVFSRLVPQKILRQDAPKPEISTRANSLFPQMPSRARSHPVSQKAVSNRVEFERNRVFGHLFGRREVQHHYLSYLVTSI